MEEASIAYRYKRFFLVCQKLRMLKYVSYN